jgi:hypothetical protein
LVGELALRKGVVMKVVHFAPLSGKGMLRVLLPSEVSEGTTTAEAIVEAFSAVRQAMARGRLDRIESVIRIVTPQGVVAVDGTQYGAVRIEEQDMVVGLEAERMAGRRYVRAEGMRIADGGYRGRRMGVSGQEAEASED